MSGPGAAGDVKQSEAAPAAGPAPPPRARPRRRLVVAVAGSFEQLLLSAERAVGQAEGVCRRRVEQDDPDAPLILEALARGYLRQYRLGEARFCLDVWLGKQPDNPQALCLKGQFHM